MSRMKNVGIKKACAAFANIGGAAQGSRVEAAAGAHYDASSRNISQPLDLSGLFVKKINVFATFL